MPATPTAADHDAAEKPEVFLAPRVVDERAFRSLSERLRELVENAQNAEDSLNGAATSGRELLTSLEAQMHTQSRRAREVRTAIENAERRLEKFNETGAAETLERAQLAQQALSETVTQARSLQNAAPASELVHEAAKRERALRELIARAESAFNHTSAAASQIDALRQQTESLLSATRATILECADARDAADARLERLTGLAAKIERRIADVEARAAAIRPPEIDLDPIVREVAARVMKAVESRLDTAVARHGDRPDVRAAPAVAPAVPHRTPSRARRVTTLPVGASGELGDPSLALMLWGWGSENY